MGDIRFLVASTDENYDVIGVYQANDSKEYVEVCRKHRPHSVFEKEKDALKEARRISIGKAGNGAFFVKKIDENADYLVFRCGTDGDRTDLMDYLTTRRAIANVLEVNQENGIPWETVDAVLEDYEANKAIGDELFGWLAESDILDKRDHSRIKRLEFHTKKTRRSAIAY